MEIPNVTLSLGGTVLAVTLSLTSPAPASTGFTWGEGIGSLSDQADLQEALDAKADGTAVTAAIADLTATVGEKADADDVTAALTSKANSADVTAALAGKADNAATTAALASKADAAATTTALAGKAATGAIGASGLTMLTARFLARFDPGSGPVQEATLGAGFSFAAGELQVDVPTALGFTPYNPADISTDTTLGGLSPSNTLIPGQLAVKTYVDNSLTGLRWKFSVRTASKVNVNLAAGCQNGSVVGGVTVATGDRVALMGQTTGADRGLYVVAASGAPTRTTDANTSAKMLQATFMVEAGDNADTQWTCSNDTITLGTTALTFAQVSGAGTYTADGTTITLTGNSFAITAGGVGVSQLADAAVTYAKFQNASTTQRVMLRKSAGAGSYEEGTLSDLLDFIGSAAQGDVLYRGASGWARLGAGAANAALITGGAGANPAWSNTLSLATLAATPPANNSALAVSGFSLTGANAQSLLDLAGAWNTSGTPTALKLNITDTASNAASLLLDLRVGGASQFAVTKGGVLNLGATNSFITPQLNGISFGGSHLRAFVGGTNTANTHGIVVSSAGLIGFGSVTSPSTFAYDTAFARDAAGVMALRQGANAQTFNVYNTYTDASNYERGFARWNANVFEIGTEKAGTGSARAMSLTPADIRAPNLPTSDPHVAGRLWSNSGVLTVSAG